MNLINTVNGINLNEVVQNPENYPDEVLAASVDIITDMYRQISEAKKRTEGKLKTNMIEDNATKLVFKDNSGKERIATLNDGSMVPIDPKTIDIVYKKNGFDPLEIGEYVFKPSWQKVKQAIKFGGEKKRILEELFQEGEKKLKLD